MLNLYQPYQYASVVAYFNFFSEICGKDRQLQAPGWSVADSTRKGVWEPVGVRMVKGMFAREAMTSGHGPDR